MATSEPKIECGTCKYHGLRKAANKWCTNCNEGLCRECERHHQSSKLSRSHKLLLVKDYVKIQHTTTVINCTVHSKSYELYCKDHDEAICVACLPLKHQKCNGLVPIDDEAKKYKSSRASEILLGTIQSALDNAQTLHDTGKSAFESIDEEKRQIQARIQAIRNQINARLDSLQDSLTKQVEEKHTSCTKIYNENMLMVNVFEKRLKTLKDSLKSMSEHATDVQMFLSSKNIKEETEQIVKTLKETMGNVVSFHLNIEIEPMVDTLINDLTLAKIEVAEAVMSFPYRGFSLDQAQMPIYLSGSDLYQKFKIEKAVDILLPDNWHISTGCTILTSGEILIADGRGPNKLVEYDDAGIFRQHLNLSVDAAPWDVATLGNNYIAVTVPSKNSIVIISLDTAEERTVQFQGQCCGVACQDNKIYVVVRSVGIVEVAKTGEIIKSIKIAANLITNLTVSKDKLFYTNNEDNSINCCTTTGKLIWKFRDGALTKLFGISADNFGNVFVVNKEKHSVMLIKHDGTEIRTLINNDKEIERPTAVYFDHGKTQLLVCNETGRAAIYNVCI